MKNKAMVKQQCTTRIMYGERKRKRVLIAAEKCACILI